MLSETARALAPVPGCALPGRFSGHRAPGKKQEGSELLTRGCHGGSGRKAILPGFFSNRSCVSLYARQCFVSP
jgi:hypothetical protein